MSIDTAVVAKAAATIDNNAANSLLNYAWRTTYFNSAAYVCKNDHFSAYIALATAASV